MSKDKGNKFEKRCIDCNKRTKGHGKRCYSCENKRKHKLGIIKKSVKKYYCIDCKGQISRYAKRCFKCHLKFNKGKNHQSYNPKFHKPHYCKIKGCNNKICQENYRSGSRRCRTCAGKLQSKRMKNSPFTSTSIAKHHVYLEKNNNKILKLTYSKHAKLHSAVYEYLYNIQGKKGIDKYIKWFDKTYGLK